MEDGKREGFFDEAHEGNFQVMFVHDGHCHECGRRADWCQVTAEIRPKDYRPPHAGIVGDIHRIEDVGQHRR